MPATVSLRQLSQDSTLFKAEALAFRFGCRPFAFFEGICRGDPGTTNAGWPVDRLLFDVVEVTDSASDPLRAFDLCFVIPTQFAVPLQGAGWLRRLPVSKLIEERD